MNPVEFMQMSDSELEKTPKEIQENRQKNIKSVPYFISQFSWFFFPAAFVILGFIFPRNHFCRIIYSSKIHHKWDPSIDPIIFTHTSDIYVSNAEPSKIVNARLLVQMMSFFRPDFNLITGNIVDSYGKENFPKIGKQIKEDWELWKEIISQEVPDGNFPIIDVPGNHDMWAIDDPLGINNLYLDYSYTFNRSNTKNIRDFYVKTVKTHDITFILVNLFRFPTVHPPYMNWPHPTTQILDYIEDEFDKQGQNKFYVAIHYPIDSVWQVKSSKGRSFEDICQDSRILAIFSGHFHPPEAQIIHYDDGAMELIAPGSYRYKTFGIVTIDNDRMVYHNIHLTNPSEKFLMTHPIPVHQVSNQQMFAEQKTEIRIISYSNKNVTLKVQGDVTGTMKFVRKHQNGASIYSYPLNLPYGEYTIHVTGDGCNITRNFVISQTCRGKKEKSSSHQRGFFFLKVASLPIFISMFIMLFPFFPNSLFGAGKTEKWIQGRRKSWKQSRWMYITFLSPFVLRARILCLPHSIRYLLFFSLLYPFCLPLHIFKPIYGLHGWSFACFIVISDNIYFDEWAYFMTLFYYCCVVAPAAILVSSYKLYLINHWMFKFNLIFSIFTFIGLCYVNYRWVGESVITTNLFLNPTFVIIPVILYMTIYFVLLKGGHRHRNRLEALTS